MRKTFGGYLAGLVVSAASAVAANAAEQTFEDKVRAYLLSNPEVILEALAVLTEREEAAARKAQIDAYPELFTRKPILGIGDPEADVRVVEFFDYKCLPCKAVHAPLAALVDTNPNLRVEMRQLPILTPGSEKATRFAFAVLEVAGKEAYASAHDMLWAHRGPFNTAVFSRMTEALGLELDVLDPVMWSDEVTEKIDFNRDMAIDLNLVGTPAFVTPTDIAVGTTDIELLKVLFLNQ